MNKTAIKNFAIWARNKLIADIGYRAGLMGITEKGIADALPQSTLDAEFYDIGAAEPYLVAGDAIKQRRQLVAAIREKEADTDYKTAYRYIIEEVAYTWFNRLIAVRFMEVNDYLPSHLRVLSSESDELDSDGKVKPNGKLEPDLVTTPFDADLPFTAEEEARILQWKQDNKLDELFRFLFIRQCNALNEILPGLFEKTTDYTELLLNLSVVDREGVVYKLTHDIPENDFNVEQGGQVEIIGWLYQYYNTEPKAAAFAKNGKITKEEIPAVTQLFTPDWIVRYMVENSLGRIFISGQLSVASGQCSVVSGQCSSTSDHSSLTTGHSSVGSAQSSDSSDHSSLTTVNSKWSEQERIAKEQEIADRMGWKYYLPEAEQTPEVRAKLSGQCSVGSGQCSGSSDHSSLTTSHYPLITELTLIDPCMGSGHILVYAFDVLMQIYTSVGYSERDAAKCILEHNLYGLDIDDRAYQLAYFAVMMKARQYNRRILNGENTCRVYAIQESNTVNRAHLKYFGAGLDDLEKNTARMQLEGLLDALTDAKEYGSILNVPEYDWELLRRFVEGSVVSGQLSVDSIGIEKTEAQLKQLIDLGETMARKYWVTVTNPPYAGTSNLSAKVNNFVKKYYPDSKADLFAVFIERCRQMTADNGFQAMITQHSWMFLSSFEKLREKMMLTETVNMAHLGARAFEEIGGEVVQTTAFVRCANHVNGYKGTYCRLIEPTSQQGKEEMFLAGQNRYTANQDDFAKIPGAPVAYWVSQTFFKMFDNPKIFDYTFSDGQNKTGDNDKYLRCFWEVENKKIGESKHWVQLAKGGGFRRWYGNILNVIDWSSEAREHYKKDSVSRIIPEYIWYKEGITWGDITSYKPSFRVMPQGMTFETAGLTVFLKDNANEYYAMGILNSCIFNMVSQTLNGTFHTKIKDVQGMPFIIEEKERVDTLVKNNIILSKSDWDSFETSWDFTAHPLASGQWLVDSDQHTDHCTLITDHYTAWSQICNDRFTRLKANEEELNRIFIEIYGLQDELTPEVEDKDVTVRRADLTREIKSLLSYAVGCMFGRYSLDVEGLAFAGGEFSDQWVVVSGQYCKREVVEQYVSEELQRTLGMAEVDADCGGNVPAGEAAAEGRIVRFVRPDAQGGGVHTFQYRRGAGTELYKGIRELSLDRAGVSGGTGNAVYDLCSPEILAAITNGTGDELAERGWKDAQRIDWQTIHSALTTGHFSPDADNVIPITDEEYLEDDIVARLCDWLKVVYGADTLEANLDYIAKALGNKGSTSREIIRNYFVNDFFKDHCQTYSVTGSGKRPIYWLFDSGKQNGFKALVYLHRYTPDTIGTLRVDYLHKMQRVYESEINRMQDTIDHSTNAREAAAAAKRKDKLTKQLKECRDYDEKISHLALSRIALDLDDGVKVNYRKLQTANDGKFYEVLADSKNIMAKEKK